MTTSILKLTDIKKPTRIKILAGIHKPTSDTVEFDDKPITFERPHAAEH